MKIFLVLVVISILGGCKEHKVHRTQTPVIQNGQLRQTADQCHAQPQLAWCKP